MKEIVSTLSNKYTREFNKHNILYAHIYCALVNNKKVLYITNLSTKYVEHQFKYLFNIKIKCVSVYNNKNEKYKAMKIILIK
jgi:hypothetical protein